MQHETLYRRIRTPIPLTGGKVACFTIDIEPDYGGRTGTTELLQNTACFIAIKDMLQTAKIPASAFITTGLFSRNNNNASGDPSIILSNLHNSGISDFHCHSHTHNTTLNLKATPQEEITESYRTFNQIFGKPPCGWRAPQGIIYPSDIDILKDTGFKFSSSIFPSYRPGKFNHLKYPATPFIWDNGLPEFPLSTIKILRIIMSISWAKLLGIKPITLLSGLLGLPPVVIIDSHLHDFFINKNAYNKLPLWLRTIYRRNMECGTEIFFYMVKYLKSAGYTFITMTELYSQLLYNVKATQYIK